MSVSALRKDHIYNQSKAANPYYSVWVSANAGAGKTRVLVDRIIRMLLPPHHTTPNKILCMTFTRAAAAEMADRLFERLGEWIALDDKALAQELEQLTGTIPNDQDMIYARRLFARALETPGGLNIQTIHGFCEYLLKRFPVEADISPDFNILEGEVKITLFTEALETVALSTLRHKESEHYALLKKAFDHVMVLLSKTELITILINAYKIYRQSAHEDYPFWNIEALCSFLEIDPFDSPDQLYQEFFSSLPLDRLHLLLNAYRESSKNTDQAHGQKLKTIVTLLSSDSYTENLQELIHACEAYFLTGGDVRKKLGTNIIKDNYPELYQEIMSYAEAFFNLQQTAKNLTVFEHNQALITVMMAVYPYYDQMKTDQSLFDHDDLIDKARGLLCNKEVSSWVLYKLDGGIEHILIDEAQDTAPIQWDIIRAISDEFFSDYDGAHRHRTIFAVGDEKQSIYSFQDADPYQMASNKQYFSEKIDSYEKKWLSTSLKGSFRSAPAILSLVDKVFSSPEAAKGVQFMKEFPVEHHAVNHPGSGYIHISAPVIAEKAEEERVWSMPLDQVMPQDSVTLLAKQIVKNIQNILSDTHILPSTQQKPRPQDILILLQKRGALQRVLTKELKAHHIPVAGADRLFLLDDIAVLDLLAVIDFVLFPEDDLTCAVLLKSPLCGLSEEDLYDLCVDRTHNLWRTLTLRAADNPLYEQAHHFLKAMLSQADFAPPYEFLMHILIVHKGRQKLRSSIGDHCLEAIDALLNKALSYERDHTPSLQGFVLSMRRLKQDLKREADQTSDEVRIMTVHGAKGLEAPIVILADTHHKKVHYSFHETLSMIPDQHCPVWLKDTGETPNITAFKQTQKDLQQEEYRRLLYVALTRAKDQLYIHAIAKSDKKKAVNIVEDCWYHYILDGLKKMDHVQQISHPDNPQLISYSYHDSIQADIQEIIPDKKEAVASPLPQWAHHPIKENMTEVMEYLKPSTAEHNIFDMASKEIIKNQEKAMQRGRIIHKILEYLPKVNDQDRIDYIRNQVTYYPLSTSEQETISEEIITLLEHPDIKELFSHDGIPEARFVGKLPDIGQPIKGQIDYMVILEDRILVLDYKSDQSLKTLKDVSKKYITQMTLYHKVLQNIYPDKQIDAYLIGTHAPCVIALEL